MNSINYFDILVFIIFSFVSYSLYKTLKGESNDILVSSSKAKNNIKIAPRNMPSSCSSCHQATITKGKRIITTFASNSENLDELESKTLRLMKMDKDFIPHTFLVDAKMIFDAIFNAFYKKDLTLINNITTPAVFDRLKSAVENFNKNNESLKAEIIRFKSAGINDIVFSSNSSKIPDIVVSIVVDFQTEQSAVVLNEDKKAVRGDDNQIVSMSDRVVFTRDFSEKKSTWLLSDILSVS